ncbi:recombinase family protein [Methylobacterium sp. CM6257]
MAETPKKPKAYSYLRFSTADQAKGDSFRRQTALAEDYARRNGLDLDTELTFEDRGISAFSGRNKRKGALRTFLDLVDEGIIPEGSYLLVESLDRISREAILEAQGTFLMIINAGITLVTLKGSPRVYSRETVTANPTDLLISLIELIRAREESETKSGRIKADWLKKRERAAKGEAITSLVPAWLRRDGKKLVEIPERADVVRRIFDLTLRGVGQHAITSILSKEGVPAFGGGRLWHRSYVKRVLENPAVIGTFTPHRMVDGRREPMEPIRDYFPAIISAETFEAVRALDRPVGKAPPTATASIFSGLAKCEECGGPMIRARKGNARRGLYYVFVCQGSKLAQGCESRSVRQRVLEDALIENIDRFVLDAPSHDEGLTAEFEKLEIEIEVTQEQIASVVEAIAIKRLPSLMNKLTELEIVLEELKNRRERVEAELRDTAKPVVSKRLDDLEAAIRSGAPIDVGRTNVLLRQLVDRAVIHFNRETSRRRPRGQIEFIWKAGSSTYLRFGPLFDPVRRVRRGRDEQPSAGPGTAHEGSTAAG